MENTCIYIFRNDQRIDDNPAFNAACQQFETLLPIYVFDTALFKTGPYGSKRYTTNKYNFLRQSLKDLHSNLQTQGLYLGYAEGDPIQILTKLKEETGIEHVCIQDEPGTYEAHFILQLKQIGFIVHIYEGAELFETLPFSIENLPFIFTDFRKKVESAGKMASTIKSYPERVAAFDLSLTQTIQKYDESVTSIHTSEMQPLFTGGETQAKQRVQNYLFETKNIRTYKETRNEMIGMEYSSKFSVWLANGNMSARYCVEQIKLHEEKWGANESTYWLIFELLWREFFRLNARKFGAALFYSSGIRAIKTNKTRNDILLNKWKTGQTGQAFVDACMRELSDTGYLSNRGRQNVASYLVHDLGIDWRCGAAYFEEVLLDYDVSSNWGNWQYIAGVGNDPRFRKFNVTLQAARYDAEQVYQKLWGNK